VLAGSPASTRADDALEAAKKRYEAGERDYVAGRYWQAAKAFEEAFALSRRGDLLFNAARAYDRGEYSVRALEAYQAYIDSTPDAPDKDQIAKRISELRASLAKILIVTREKGFVFVDGHEYGRTPMQQPMDIDSGYHRVEVRKDNASFSVEQQFSSGQSYSFDAEFKEGGPSGRGLADTIADEEQRPKQKTRRVAAVLGIGGAIDVAGNNFPPHQAALYLGVDYRVVERPRAAFDFAVRLPIEFGGSWRNAGFLLGGRVAITPAPRLPLEITLELDLGLGVLSYSSSAPPLPSSDTRGDCARQPLGLAECTLYGLRLHPKLGLAYRVLPSLELRGELFGAEVNLGTPIPDPRITVGAAAAFRFY
jgi:hypothetical protein